jgi:hypothetical protein
MGLLASPANHEDDLAARMFRFETALSFARRCECEGLAHGRTHFPGVDEALYLK